MVYTPSNTAYHGKTMNNSFKSGYDQALIDVVLVGCICHELGPHERGQCPVCEAVGTITKNQEMKLVTACPGESCRVENAFCTVHGRKLAQCPGCGSVPHTRSWNADGILDCENKWHTRN